MDGFSCCCALSFSMHSLLDAAVFHFFAKSIKLVKYTVRCFVCRIDVIHSVFLSKSIFCACLFLVLWWTRKMKIKQKENNNLPAKISHSMVCVCSWFKFLKLSVCDLSIESYKLSASTEISLNFRATEVYCDFRYFILCDSWIILVDWLIFDSILFSNRDIWSI